MKYLYKKNNRQEGKKGFSLIEILVVATIIGLLAAVAAVSYSSLNANSRDARRKADIEQIRSALEMYRSNSDYSSYPTSTASLVSDYIQALPTDPETGSDYTYTESPGACADSAPPATPCSSYTLTATLDDDSTYTATPYGAN